MPLIRINPKPGINTQLSQVANENGYSSGSLIRHRLGLIEKLAGWTRLVLHGTDTCAGFIRVLHPWLDLGNNKNMLLGTDGGPQLIVNDTLYDLLLVTGGATEGTTAEFANFSVTIGGSTVTVGVPTTFVITVNQQITLRMPVSIGGKLLAVDTSYVVTSVAVGSFTFTMPTTATYTEAAAVGIPRFSFPWATNTCTVTFRRHGLAPAGSFTVDQTTTIVSSDFLAVVTIPAGTVLSVLTTPTVDTFTFNYTPYITFSGGASGTGLIYEGSVTDTSIPPPLTTTFGTVFSLTGTISAVLPESNNWFSDNLGQNGLMTFSGSPLYVYQAPNVQPVVGSTPTLSAVGGGNPATAPQTNMAMFVAMPQAQVILLGTEAVMGSGSVDPLLLRFSDAGTYDTWEADVTNQAGSYRLSRGSKIVGGIQSPQTTLIFTDTDVWSMNYIGPPLVYGFTIMGTNCGLVSPRAVGTLGRTTFWVSSDSVWSFGDGGVTPVPCSVWDFIFRDLDTANLNKIFIGTSAATNEIYINFCSATDTPIPTPVNLLQFTEEFGGYAWALLNSTVAVGPIGPDPPGATNQLVEDTAMTIHGAEQSLTKDTQNIEYTLSVYCHTSSTRNLALSIIGLSGSATAIFNPVTGTLVTSAAAGTDLTLITAGATTDALGTGIAGNGWVRYFLTVTSDASPSLIVQVLNANSTATRYTGNGASGVIVWGAQLNLDTLAPYEAVLIASTNEPTRYVKYNTAERLWDCGIWPSGGVRTAWTDTNIFGPPMGGDYNYRVQQHELGYDDDTEPMRGAFVETGYGTMQDGSTVMSVDQIQPDMKWFGNDGGVDITIKSIRYPGGPVNQFGPYAITPTTQFMSTRARAKMMAVRYEWAAIKGFSARIGAMTYRVKPAGTRP